MMIPPQIRGTDIPSDYPLGMSCIYNERHRLTNRKNELQKYLKDAMAGSITAKNKLRHLTPMSDGSIIIASTKKSKHSKPTGKSEYIPPKQPSKPKNPPKPKNPTKPKTPSKPKNSPKSAQSKNPTSVETTSKEPTSLEPTPNNEGMTKKKSNRLSSRRRRQEIEEAQSTMKDATNSTRKVDANSTPITSNKRTRQFTPRKCKVNTTTNVAETDGPVDLTTEDGVSNVAQEEVDGPPMKKAKRKKKNGSTTSDPKNKQSNNKQLPLRSNAPTTATDSNTTSKATQVDTPQVSRKMSLMPVEEIFETKFTKEYHKKWPFKCPPIYVFHSDIMTFREQFTVVNAIRYYHFNNVRPIDHFLTDIHKIVIGGEVDLLDVIAPKPNAKNVIAPFLVRDFVNGKKATVNIIKQAHKKNPHNYEKVKLLMLYYQMVTQFLLIFFSLINNPEEVQCHSTEDKDEHMTLHKFICHQLYSDVCRALEKESLAEEMKCMDTDLLAQVKGYMIFNSHPFDGPRNLDLEFVKDMCGKAMQAIDPWLDKSELLPVDPEPKPGKHSTKGKTLEATPQDSPLNVAELPTAHADSEVDDDSPDDSPSSPSSDEDNIQPFDINRFLQGFSTANSAAGRMLHVKEHITEGKAIKMGVTFANQARGTLELVLVKNRHTEYKTLPYLSAIGVVSRKSMAGSKKKKNIQHEADAEDETGDDGCFEIPRRTGRSNDLVYDLMQFTGKDGYGVYKDVITGLLDCHKSAIFVHPPMLHLPEVQITNRFYICFTNMPYRKDMVCPKHPYGCGLSLKVGDVVRVHATERCKFIKGIAWYMPVARIDSSGNLSCNVGIAKTFPTQGHILANRTAIVSNLVKMDEPDEKNKGTQTLELLCGHAEATFIDNIVPRKNIKATEEGI